VERSSGKAATITLWSSEQAAQASAQQADEMRPGGAAGSHSIGAVQTHEVALRVDGG